MNNYVKRANDLLKNTTKDMSSLDWKHRNDEYCEIVSEIRTDKDLAYEEKMKLLKKIDKVQVRIIRHHYDAMIKEQEAW